MPGSSRSFDAHPADKDGTDNPFEGGLAGRRRKAAITLAVVWLGTITLHLVPGGFWVIVGLSLLVGIHLFRAMFTRPRPPVAPLEGDSADYPFISLLVAAKNEEAVISGLVKNLCALDYPQARYDVWIIDDASTDNTPAILDRMGQAYANLHVVHRPAGAGGGKSGALNDVWPRTSADIMAVFDADAQVPQNLLRRVVPLFRQADVGAVQVRKAIANAPTNFWTRAQAGEMLLDSYVQEQRIASGGMGELRGNGQFVRRRAIEDCHGWNEETITDDLDLTLRLHLNRWSISHLFAPAVQEEGVTGAVSLWHQRSRWAEGGYQRYLDYWRLIAQNRLGTRKTIDMVMFLIIQYLVPTAAIPDLMMALARGRFPILSVMTTLTTGFSLVGATMGQRRLRRAAAADPAETALLAIAPASTPWQKLLTAGRILLRSLRTTVYMLHWMLVIGSTSIRIAIRPKRLKWVKTVHRGSSEADDGGLLIDI